MFNSTHVINFHHSTTILKNLGALFYCFVEMNWEYTIQTSSPVVPVQSLVSCSSVSSLLMNRVLLASICHQCSVIKYFWTTFSFNILSSQRRTKVVVVNRDYQKPCDIWSTYRIDSWTNLPITHLDSQICSACLISFLLRCVLSFFF